MAKTITVKNSAELYAALGKATGGETILLEGGNYGSLKMSEYTAVKGQYASEVTIKSADAENPATFGYMELRDVNNITFDTIKFDYNFNSSHTVKVKPFTISDSSNVTIRNSVFDGDTAEGKGAANDGYGYGQALVVRYSNGITVENNEFYDFTHGAIFGNVKNLVVSDNDVHSIRSDGFNFAAVQNVLIENNYLHDFEASPSSYDHRDMIQFWTNGTSTPTKNVIIRGNTLDIGDGNYTQSIFMRNEEVDTGRAGTEMYYQNILIEDNVIYNAHLHGITVGETNGLTIRDNALIAVPSTIASEANRGGVSIPAINVKSASTGVTITDNLVSKINGAGNAAVVSDNLLIQNTDPSKPNYYGDVFVDSSLTPVGGVNSFIVKPGTIADIKNIGPDALQYDSTPSTVTALVETARSETNARTVIFDATLSADKSGVSIQDTGKFLWDFGDGTTAKGLVVSHTYKDAGKYEAKLTVINSSGAKDVAEVPIKINSADVLSFNEKTGRFVAYSFGDETVVGNVVAKTLATSFGTGLELGGTGVQARVGGVSRLSDADSFNMTLKLKADAGSAAWGEVMRIHTTLLGSINQDGSFYLTLTTEDGTIHKLTTKGVKLNDGKVHDLKIAFDGDAGSLKIIVDGTVAASKAVYGDVKQVGSSVLEFGNTWGKKNFEGVLLDFDLDVDMNQYPNVTKATTDVLKHGGTTHSSGADIPAVVPEPEPQDQVDSPTADVTETPVTHESTAAVLSGGYRLNLDAVTSKLATMARDDANVVTEDGQKALRFDGDQDYVSLSRLKQFEQSEKIAFEIDYSRDVADGSADRLVWNHLKLGLTVEGDGLVVHAATADEGLKAFKIGKLGLNDTDTHNIKVLIDQDEDRLQVLVDDKVVLDNTSTDFDFVGAGGSEWGWHLGGPWKQFFDGDITDFQVTDTFTFQDDASPQDPGLLS